MDSNSSRYKFTEVFGPTVSQAAFFKSTALPLVDDLLQGKSGLCFAYGVTASGKTYTVSGDQDPGILPRTIDVVFNSLAGKQTDCFVRPSRLNAVEATSPGDSASYRVRKDVKNLRSAISDASGAPVTADIKDDTVVPVDEGCEYSVWISYAEVYNEKVYDLLDAQTLTPSSSANSLHSFTASLAEQVKQAAQHLTKAAAVGGGTVKRKALSLKHDKANGNKYIAGLTEVRVWTADEGKTLLRKGQINRSVFSTLANRTSSRSHGIFTIKVLRIPKAVAATGDPSTLVAAASVSRLSVVDLAGSERTRNTQTTGERLKEAGNINKSLMVLGQCMEVLRRNQDVKSRHLASHVSPKLAVVPFRHSKLTEIFQSYFTGEGRAVMIVNANPCDTGFEENQHVMRFSAVASEVATTRERTPAPAPATRPTFVQTPSGTKVPLVDLTEQSIVIEGKSLLAAHEPRLRADVAVQRTKTRTRMTRKKMPTFSSITFWTKSPDCVSRSVPWAFPSRRPLTCLPGLRSWWRQKSGRI